MIKRITFAAVLIAAALHAQTPVYVIQANVPTPVNLSVSQVGAQGTTKVCYWIIAVYTGGKSAPYGPACTNTANGTLSSTNYNVVAFSAPASTISAPTGYDLLRTPNETAPTGVVSGTSGSVSTAQAASPLNDQSNTLSSYTVATLQVTSDTVLDAVSGAPTLITRYSGVNTTSSTNTVFSVEGSLTVAQLATGRVIVPGVAGHTMKLLGAAILPVGGTVATCTAINFTDSALGATQVFSFLASGTLTAILYDEASPAAQVTIGGGTAWGTAFGSGLGIGLINTGSTCTTTTSLLYRAYYRIL